MEDVAEVMAFEYKGKLYRNKEKADIAKAEDCLKPFFGEKRSYEVIELLARDIRARDQLIEILNKINNI